MRKITPVVVTRRIKPGGGIVMGASFSPTIPPADSPARADLLGKFVPTSISRMPPVARMLRPFQIACFGVISAGIIPLFQLRSRLNEYISFEQQQLELAAELAQHHVDAEEASELTRAAKNISSSGWVSWIGDLALAGAIISLFVTLQMNQWSNDGFRQFFMTRGWELQTPAMVWLGLISLGYLTQYRRINFHITRLQQFAMAFNASMEGRCAMIDIPPHAWGLRIGHLAVGGLMLFFATIWVMPMMIAWAAYQTFVYNSDASFRAELSDRLQWISGVAPVVERAGLCRNPSCDQLMPADARFCPRCGRKTGDN